MAESKLSLERLLNAMIELELDTKQSDLTTDKIEKKLGDCSKTTILKVLKQAENIGRIHHTRTFLVRSGWEVDRRVLIEKIRSLNRALNLCNS